VFIFLCLPKYIQVLGPSASFVHVTFRFAQRYNFAVAEGGAPVKSSSSSSEGGSGSKSIMCDWSTLELWATEQAYRGYDVANPYHNALHAADVALTANAYLDSCGALGPGGRGSSSSSGGSSGSGTLMRWWWHRYALMLASLCHDLGHPARMNPFMLATKNPLTQAYLNDNGVGVLETMHVARFNASLRVPG
jgi:hypothetical protein